MRRRPFFLGLALLASGCATIIHGTTQEIPVTSDPPGAEVRMGGRRLGTTPTKIVLDRKPDYEIEILKPGFQAFRQRLESVSQYDALSVFGGGLIGWGLDSASGGNKRLYPESIHAVLVPGDGMAPVAAPAARSSSSEPVPLTGTWKLAGGQTLVIRPKSVTTVEWEFTAETDGRYVVWGTGADPGTGPIHWVGRYVESPGNNSRGRNLELRLQQEGPALYGKIITGTLREYDATFRRVAD